MKVERVDALRIGDKYFVKDDIVNLHTIDGEYYEQVCIDAIGDEEILIDAGVYGNWLKFSDIDDMILF
jgi:hypothetical protein